MARNDRLDQILVEQNGRKKLIKTVALGTTGSLISIGTKDADNNNLPDSFTLVLQADQDFLYELAPASVLATRVTVQSGSRPGVRVLANEQEAAIPFDSFSSPNSYGKDTQVDVIAATTAGHIALFAMF